MTARHAILVIDDDADVREVLRVLLEQDGHRASGAGTPEEAMRLADGTRFDVVLCDLHLGHGGDGFALASALRPRMPQARFLALTGDASEAALDRATSAGFADVLVKPVDYAALLAAIDTP